MSKSVPIRVIRAALERHNLQVEHQIHLLKHKLQIEADTEILDQLEQANELLTQVEEIRKNLKKEGWNPSIEGTYGREKLKLAAVLTSENMQQRIRAAKIKIPKKMTENELLLAIASTGEDDIAKALDQVKLFWRPTNGYTNED